MKIKHYKFLSAFISFFTGAFICSEIVNYPSLFEKQSGYSTNMLIAQGVFIVGLLCLLALYAIILHNLNNKGVFTTKNEKAFRYFGFAILIFGVAADILFKNITDIETSAPRILAFLGATLVFISYLFKIGIKMQEEQDLTI